MTILIGDCREHMAAMEPNSVDAIVTDPPYELGFMGKKWDGTGIAFDPATWESCLRVLKPGGHLVAFSGTRTSHRMICAIEDAGFEIRDSLSWNYGSGFPKSLNLSKAIQDDLSSALSKDARRSIDTTASYPCGCSDSCRQCGAPLRSDPKDALTAARQPDDVQECSHPSEPLEGTQQDTEHRCTASVTGLSDHLSTLGSLARSASVAFLPIREVASFLCPTCFVQSVLAPSGGEAPQGGIDWSSIDSSSVVVAWADNERLLRSWNMSSQPYNQYTTRLRSHDGFGTALKPGHEPICLARKPLSGTVAGTVLAYGTGAINVDACRIGTDHITAHGGGKNIEGRKYGGGTGIPAIEAGSNPHIGRWPANVILDETSSALLDAMSGERPSGSGNKSVKNHHDNAVFGKGLGLSTRPSIGGDTGGASRFFYTAKASRTERSAGLDAPSSHPTVKPISLMRWLVRLVTPPGGIILDPFTGSGSTGCAAVQEGFAFIGMELSDEYAEIAERRIAHHILPLLVTS